MKKKFLISSSLFIVLGFFLKLIEVPLDVTETDAFYINRILSKTYPHRADISSFEEEVRIIQSVLEDIHKAVPPFQGHIPHGQRREPQDLYAKKVGACYDMSRLVEKTFRYLGFEVRHASLYYDLTRSKVRTLVTPQALSHSVSEVLTRRGWMVLDSFMAYAFLDKNLKPLSLSRLQKGVTLETFRRSKGYIKDCLATYTGKFMYIYGLYSRHGQFYPPFTPVPDVNYGELLLNLVD